MLFVMQPLEASQVTLVHVQVLCSAELFGAVQ